MRPTCAQGLKEGVSVPSRFVQWESNRAWVYRVGQPRLQPGGSQLPLCGLFTGTAVGLGLGATYTLPRLTQAPRASLLLLAAPPTSVLFLFHPTSQEPWDTAFTTSSPGVR